MPKLPVKPGEIIEVRRLAAEFKSLLLRTSNVTIIYMAIPAGMTIPTHEARGEIILHCLEGRVSLTALAKTQELRAGQLTYFLIDEPVSIQAIEQASLVVTVITAKTGQNVELIGNGE